MNGRCGRKDVGCLAWRTRKVTSKVDTVVNLSTSECASVAFHQASRSEEPPILLAWQERLIFGTEKVLQASCNSAIGGWRRPASNREDGLIGMLPKFPSTVRLLALLAAIYRSLHGRINRIAYCIDTNVYLTLGNATAHAKVFARDGDTAHRLCQQPFLSMTTSEMHFLAFAQLPGRYSCLLKRWRGY
jgi:hypothetical protein